MPHVAYVNATIPLIIHGVFTLALSSSRDVGIIIRVANKALVRSTENVEGREERETL